MATQILTIKFDAKTKSFTEVKGNKIETFHSDYVSADKWICRVRADGSVDCKASETINNKYYEIDFSITKRGKIRCTKLIDGRREEIASFQMWHWPANGTLLLSSGPVATRTAFFKREVNEKK